MNKRSYKHNKGHAIADSAIQLDGIFGEIGQLLNANDALAIGCTLGTMLKTKDQCLVIVGIDNRASSEVLETEMCRGLAASGCYVMRAGVAPAPAVQFNAHCLNAASVVITGSGEHHDVNGFRLCADGAPIYGNRLQRLTALAANGSWHKAPGGVLDGNILEMYLKKLKQNVRSKTPFKIAWDLCGGTACTILPDLSDDISGEHLMMNDQPDPQFGFELPESFTESRIANLTGVVLDEKCDLGIIINADCTQIAVVDHYGKLWQSHRLFALFCQKLLKTHPDSIIVAGMDCPTAIKQCLEASGKLELVPVGLGSVLEKLSNTKASLAYGGNGHYAFGEHYNFMAFNDGLFSAVTLLNLLSSADDSLGNLYNRFPDHVTLPRRYFEHDAPDSVIQAVRKRLLLNGVAFNDLDGLRVDLDHGFWWLHSLEDDGKTHLVLDIAATSTDALEETSAAFQQYFSLIGNEITKPKEIQQAQVEKKSTLPNSARAKALKTVSDEDRVQLDFTSRHWNSIRKGDTAAASKEDAPKPKRPWTR